MCGRTDEASGCSVLQVVVLGKQRDDLGEDGFAHQLSFVVFGHDTRPHLDLLTHLEVTQSGGGGRVRGTPNSRSRELFISLISQTKAPLLLSMLVSGGNPPTQDQLQVESQR